MTLALGVIGRIQFRNQKTDDLVHMHTGSVHKIKQQHLVQPFYEVNSTNEDWQEMQNSSIHGPIATARELKRSHAS